MKKQLTPWFDGETRPAHDGVYERNFNYTSPTRFCRYADGKWYAGADTPRKAAKVEFHSLVQCSAQWRGLAVQP